MSTSVPWLDEMRRQALERFNRLGFPTVKNEDWRFTNVAPYLRPEYRLPVSESGSPQATAATFLPDLNAHRLAFVDGRLVRMTPASSGGLPSGAVVGGWAELLSREPERVRPYLHAPAFGGSAFLELNSAHSVDGAFVFVPPHQKIERPIHLIYQTSRGERPRAAHPRSVVILSEGSQATVIESFVSETGVESAGVFTNATTEVKMERGASLEHYRLQLEGPSAFHVSSLRAVLGQDSRYVSHAVSLGAALSRQDTYALLGAEGAHCMLNGLLAAGEGQHADHHLWVDHAHAHGKSEQLYKGILRGNARGVFNGRVIVRPNAQKTVAHQSNRNLLLSTDALMNTQPQLEIYADDVKCSHGATIGQLDANALFYMRSRGIGQDEAKRLLSQAFVSEVLDRMSLKPVRLEVERRLGL